VKSLPNRSTNDRKRSASFIAHLSFTLTLHQEYYADQTCKSEKKLATKGLGKTAPTKWKDAGKALGVDDLVGCHMPDNGGQPIPDITGYLQYNEYIVYDTSQIRVRYLLMVDM
jgi:poly [ADP-ribose] polymerase